MKQDFISIVVHILRIEKVQKTLRDYSKYSDNELYCLLDRKGARRDMAFTELYHRYSRKILLFLRRMLGSEAAAEDVFHETFLAVLEYSNQKKAVSNVSSFIYTIANNKAINYIKKRKPTLRLDNQIDLPDFDIADTRNYELYSSTAELIADALVLLSDEQREAFCLQGYLGMKYNEIAENLNVPVSTIRNRIVRAKSKLRQILSPFVGEQFNYKAENE